MIQDTGDPARGSDEVVAWTMYRLSEHEIGQDQYVWELRDIGAKVVPLVKPKEPETGTTGCTREDTSSNTRFYEGADPSSHAVISGPAQTNSRQQVDRRSLDRGRNPHGRNDGHTLRPLQSNCGLGIGYLGAGGIPDLRDRAVRPVSAVSCRSDNLIRNAARTNGNPISIELANTSK